MYDLIIIGGGPAAISAGIYAGRKQLKTLIIAQNWGGQVSLAPLIENYPGFESILGPDLVNKFVSHLKKNDLEIQQGIAVKEIFLNKNKEVEVKTEKDKYIAKTIIITAGRNPRKLGLPNEAKFIGKGISYCSICDAPLFKNKDVAVIGGANAGLGTALDLANYASKVYIVECLSELPADAFLQKKIKKISKIKILTNTAVRGIKGDDFVNGLIYREKGSKENKEVSVKGIFVAIGSTANSSLLKNMVELNEQGEIKINSKNQTSQSNIFAAGDVTDVSHKQIVIAAGEGAKAALNVYDYINKLKKENNNYVKREKRTVAYSCF
ncbi:MAG: FAD-dependent oxidoreductase [bacterium]